MARIGCNVLNCSHNDSGVCYANRISCDYIGCNVKTCAYNAGNVCSLNNIAVTSSADSANLYSETYCSSFKCK